MESFPQEHASLKSESVVENGQEQKNIAEIFALNPELSKIGTPEQYAEYVKTIFPGSEVQDILWHGSKSKFDTFDKSLKGTNASLTELSQRGFFFSDNKNVSRFYGDKIFGSIVNLRHPIKIDDGDGRNPIGAATSRIEHHLQENPNADGVIALNFKDAVHEDDEAVASGDRGVIQNQYIVFEPNQIHILGSEADKEKFKEFVSR